MERLIDAYLDKMDDLEEKVTKDVDGLMDAIDIDEVIDNPQGSLGLITETLITMMQYKYHRVAVENGIKLAKDINDKS